MLLMVEKGIRGGICYSVYRYINDSNKIIDYDKNKEPSYLKYWGVNNLYNCTISQRLPVNDFKWVGNISAFDEKFYKKLQWRNLHNDLPFLPERMKIEYVIHIKRFKASIKS